MNNICINNVVLIGFLGAEPEYRVLESGIKMARFSLATNEFYIDKNGAQQEHTEWHKIVAWREVAGYCFDKLHRGSLVRIEGKIRSTEITDKHSLNTQRVYEIIANSVQLLTNDATTSNEQNKSQERVQNLVPPAPLDVDDIPF